MPSKSNKILVPVDFSEQSMIALSQSYNLANKMDAEIVLLYVIEEVNSVVRLFYKGLDEISKAIENNLDNLILEKQKETEAPLVPLIAKGKVYDKVVEVANNINASFIVMGTKGNSGVSKYMGSNASRVVKTAPCPVITIKGKEHKKGCDRIILPLDLSKETIDKVDKAIDLAKFFGAEIFVVSVLMTSNESVIEKLSAQMEKVDKYITSNNVKCTVEIVKIIKSEDSLGKTVVAYADKMKGDLIMIMTQQEREFKEFFIGSSAREVINYSNIPVLSILPKSKVKE